MVRAVFLLDVETPAEGTDGSRGRQAVFIARRDVIHQTESDRKSLSRGV